MKGSPDLRTKATRLIDGEYEMIADYSKRDLYDYLKNTLPAMTRALSNELHSIYLGEDRQMKIPMDSQIEEAISKILGESSVSFNSDVVLQTELEDLKKYIEAGMAENATRLVRLMAKRATQLKKKYTR